MNSERRGIFSFPRWGKAGMGASLIEQGAAGPHPSPPPAGERANAGRPAAGEPLVRAAGLAKTFDVSPPLLNRILERKPRQLLHAVDDATFTIQKGQTLALVGESGCGKSTAARLLVGLYEPTRGSFHFDGQDAHAVFKAGGQRALKLRERIQMIFQDPYASIESGRFRVRPRPANLGDIIAEAVTTMQPLLDRHGQRLAVDLPATIPGVLADPRRVVQVLVNLLSNASNAQRALPDSAGRQITISAAVVSGGQTVQVLVADHGPGIPSARRTELLHGRRFAAASASADANAPVGFGLGLSVVKAIVAGHGGQLGIDDRPGGGAVVWFTLQSDLGSGRSTLGPATSEAMR